MATLEKLMKTWETLKSIPGQSTDEVPSRRKEKIGFCVATADTFCSSGLKAATVNAFLNFSIESLLQLCDDVDSDVRMTADDSINRIVRQAIMDNHVMKIQLELHKEIKRNGAARSLRAALWRFAHLSHLIRPQKGKAYVNNLIPCLIQISKRTEESVQDTLSNAMTLIFKALGIFSTDKDVKNLLKALLQNLSSESAQTRRTAASCIVSVSLHSRKPYVFLTYIFNILLDDMVPIREVQAVSEVLGVLGCLRLLLPHVTSDNEGPVELKGSFGVKRNHKEVDLSIDRVIQVFELAIHFSRHTDHNVVNASLELLHQLLLALPNQLLPILLTPGGISRSRIASQNEQEVLTVRSLSVMSVAGSIVHGDENSLMDLDPDLPLTTELDKWIQNSSTISDSLETATSSPNLTVELVETSEVNLGQGDLSLQSEQIATESSGDSQKNIFSVLEPPRDSPKDITPPASAAYSVSPGPNDDSVRYQVCDIGSLTDGSIPLVYCARYLATSFLLTGHPGFCMPDRNVRVSVKALALNCVTCIVRLYPNVFQLYLDKEPGQCLANASSSQPLCDLLFYARHSDPLLRAVCRALVASLVHSVLVQSGGDWQTWQDKADREVASRVALSNLVSLLIQGLNDESSTTCRLTLAALSECMKDLLNAKNSQQVIPLLDSLPILIHNPYWLVKVKLVELLSDLPFVIVNYVTGSSNFEEKIINEVFMRLLENDDIRVRKAVAEAFVRIVPKLFYSVDHPECDAVVCAGANRSGAQLSNLLLGSDIPSKANQWTANLKIENIYNLVFPFDVWNQSGFSNSQHNSSTEASLSRMIYLLSQPLIQSSSKHLTLGCCYTLYILSEQYPPSVFPLAWSCTFWSVEAPPETRQNSTSGLLTAVLSLLVSSPLAQDLACQQWLIQLAGNLFSGLALSNMHAVESSLKTDTQQTPVSQINLQWAMFKDQQISAVAEALLLHSMRILNMTVHVLEDSCPSQANSKPGLPSLPIGSSVSPIKRHVGSSGKNSLSSSLNDISSDSKPIRGTNEKEEKVEDKRLPKSGNLGLFSNSPHYMKLHDLLRSAHTTFKISLETEASERILGMAHSSLKVLSQLLEVMTIAETGRLTEELLHYLKSIVCIAPCHAVCCVNQILKSVVGTNLIAFWKDLPEGRPGKRNLYPDPTDKSSSSGFYFQCFQQPYHQLLQFLSKVGTKPEVEVLPDTVGWMSAFRRRSSTKSNYAVSSKVPDTSFLASYIRLFEPMVIESLQQYTMTSDTHLQVSVLLLLTQLVQLRVNYCLLDSDMVFIGYVHKQFEFIEEGQISNAQDLISRIFHFMVLLSFEKHHSKSITTIPKVIQLCDGLMASGQNPLTHCIPALLPVVKHSFLSKVSGMAKGDIDELETQREVLVAMLLRLVEYYQVVELLSMVLLECRTWTDGQERWLRWSRQVLDSVVTALSVKRLKLDCREAQRALQRLFLCSLESSVFRPPDSLLTLLFAPMPNMESSIQSVNRWLGTVLSIILVLVKLENEEVILSRIEELEISLPSCVDALEVGTPDPLNAATVVPPACSIVSPQLTLARLILRIIGFSASRIDSVEMDPASSQQIRKDCEYMQELVAHFLLVSIHMVQSGNHNKMGSAAADIVAGHATQDSLLLEDTNAVFLELAPVCPILMFLWCHLLTLLNYNNQAFWARVLPPSFIQYSRNEDNAFGSSINVEIVRTGATIIYSDFLSENAVEAYELVSNHMPRLVELSVEPPVQSLINTLHRSPELSASLLQAVRDSCQHLRKASTVIRLLRCLEGVHLAHSGSLILLLSQTVLKHPHPALARRAAQLCARRAEYLLTLSPSDVSQQICKEDLQELLRLLHSSQLYRKHAGLLSVLTKLGSQSMSLSPLENAHGPNSIKSLELDKEWYLSQVKLRCSEIACTEESALLLRGLNVEDAVSVLSSPGIHLSVLQHCFRHGTYITLQSRPEGVLCEEEKENSLSPLYRAARLILLQHVHHYIQLIPKSHEVFLPEGREMTAAEKEYSEKLSLVLSEEKKLDFLFELAAAIQCYLGSLNQLAGSVPSESVKDLAAFSVLCLEAVHSLVKFESAKIWKPYIKQKHKHKRKRRKDQTDEIGDDESETDISEEHQTTFYENGGNRGEKYVQPHCLEAGLAGACEILCSSVGYVMENTECATWLSSVCSSVYAVVEFILDGEALPALGQNGLSEALSEPHSSSIAHACVQMSTLLVWLQQCQQDRASKNIPKYLAHSVQKLIIRLSRISFLNSYVWIPPDVWKHGWEITLSGPFSTKVPLLPTEFLQDTNILRQFIFRISLLGWTSRQQFEETWMSLLSVFNSESDGEDFPREDLAILMQTNIMVLDALTALLLQTLLLPNPGDPNTGTLIHVPRDEIPSAGENGYIAKLREVLRLLSWKQESIEGVISLPIFKHCNLERLYSQNKFGYGQMSVQYLQYALVRTQGQVELDFPETVLTLYEERENALKSCGLDLNSCLYFLLDLFTEWTKPQSQVAGLTPQPLYEIIRSAVMLSDLFTEHSQWTWLLQTCLDLSRSRPLEDDIAHQYLVLAQCKACAVLRSEGEDADRVRRTIESSLKSNFEPTVTGALQGLLYMLQASFSSLQHNQLQEGSEISILVPEDTVALVNIAVNYINKHLKNSSETEQNRLVLWSLAIFLLENISKWKIESLESAGLSIFQQAVSLAYPQNRTSSPALQRVLVIGLERLLVRQSQIITSIDGVQLITKLAVDSLFDPNPSVLLSTLHLLITCIYTGSNKQLLSCKDKNCDMMDPDQFVQAIEKTSALFDRIKKGYPLEVELICSVLPSILTDFIPASEVLTKVIGEFLSQQQPHPKLLAGVVFQVFECAVAQSQFSLLQDWMVVSLSNFTQMLPISMATWCLTCFFISASQNQWLRALFPHVQSRIGRCDLEDRKLLCLAASDFYQQLSSESQTHTFLSTFRSAVENQPHSPFADLIASLT